MNEDYVKHVRDILVDNPTAADLDFLVQAHVTLGYYASEASGLAEMADAQRKFEEASAYGRIKGGVEKITDAQAQAQALVETFPFRKEAIEAETKAKKIQHLLDSVQEAINAIKFLGRYDSTPNMPNNGVRIGGY